MPHFGGKLISSGVPGDFEKHRDVIIWPPIKEPTRVRGVATKSDEPSTTRTLRLDAAAATPPSG